MSSFKNESYVRRDPARIEPIIEQLRAAWYSHPNMRLGQLISNSNSGDADVFYMEDDELDFSWCSTQLKATGTDADT